MSANTNDWTLMDWDGFDLAWFDLLLDRGDGNNFAPVPLSISVGGIPPAETLALYPGWGCQSNQDHMAQYQWKWGYLHGLRAILSAGPALAQGAVGTAPVGLCRSGSPGRPGGRRVRGPPAGDGLVACLPGRLSSLLPQSGAPA